MLTRTQGEEFEDIFLIKTESKGTSLNEDQILFQGGKTSYNKDKKATKIHELLLLDPCIQT